jgi:hypothetical protein
MLSTIRRTTVVFPDPEPPATPMTIGGFGEPAGNPGNFAGLPASDTIFHESSRRRQARHQDLEEYQEVKESAGMSR